MTVGVLAATFTDYQGWRVQAVRAGLDADDSVWLCQPSDLDPLPVGFTLYVMPAWERLLTDEEAQARVIDCNRRAPLISLWTAVP